MAYKIVWTKIALETFKQNIDYPEREWTEKEVIKFINVVQYKINLLYQHPYIGFPKDKRSKSLRCTIINKRVSLVYKVLETKQIIELHIFWNNYKSKNSKL